jgi:hypothetical protein
MCCLRYEHEFYVQSRKRFPKEGKVIRTAKGEEKVVSNDIFRERVTLRGDDGEQRTLSLAELQSETAGIGVPLTVAQLAAAAAVTADDEDENDVVEHDVELAVHAESVDDDAEEAADDEEHHAPAATTEGEKAERKPHRRRGRRGGRRNRPGNRGPRDGGSEPSGGDGGGGHSTNWNGGGTS